METYQGEGAVTFAFRDADSDEAQLISILTQAATRYFETRENEPSFIRAKSLERVGKWFADYCEVKNLPEGMALDD